jgi:glycosyltransferase involved in cell wall biosynthesis
LRDGDADQSGDRPGPRRAAVLRSPHTKEFMKILFYNHTAQVSGAERLLLMILSRLDRATFDAVVVCPKGGPLAETVSGLSTRVETVQGLDARFTWRVDRLFRYLKSFCEVISQLRQRVIANKPDLIHANSIRSGLVATAATVGLGTRVVWHLHDLLPRHPFSTAIRCFALLSARTQMIGVSQAVAANFRGAFFPLQRRITVLLNAIDLDQFYPNPSDAQKKRDELGLSKTEMLIGIVGQITPRKGQLELLRAFAQVLVDVPSGRLLVVGVPLFNGDAEYLKLLERTAGQLGIEHHVSLLGARSDVASIMQALDLLVINSSAEPFGLVALEAMACGTAVLATNTGGLPEIIEHDKNGWLVPLRDERSLEAAIVSLASQPALRRRLAEQARKSVTSRFSADRYMSALQGFYHSCDLRPQAAASDLSEQVEAARFV